MDVKIRKINEIFGIDGDHDDRPPFSLEDMVNTLEELRAESDVFRTEVDTQEVGDTKRCFLLYYRVKSVYLARPRGPRRKSP